MGHREFKQRLYPEFARIAQALASDRRLELIDLLAQGPRNVEALATESEMSVANVSQHLQVLRAARLVEARRDGVRVVYRLASLDVLRLWLALRATATTRLSEVEALRREYAADGSDGFEVALSELERWTLDKEAVLLDVRPPEEYQAGHLPGAISLPPDEVASRLDELPRDRPIIAYCRGPYCLFADEAVALLRQNGFDAWCLEGGWPEWVAEGRPVEA
jgi:rhodanese-related sulfurtransferase/DNA-binding transcriptional ArsR family regulator